MKARDWVTGVGGTSHPHPPMVLKALKTCDCGSACCSSSPPAHAGRAVLDAPGHEGLWVGVHQQLASFKTPCLPPDVPSHSTSSAGQGESGLVASITTFPAAPGPSSCAVCCACVVLRMPGVARMTTSLTDTASEMLAARAPSSVASNALTCQPQRAWKTAGSIRRRGACHTRWFVALAGKVCRSGSSAQWSSRRIQSL